MYPTTIIGILYSSYVILVLTLMGWFVRALTSKEKINLKFKISAAIWIVFLGISVLSYHAFMHIKFPWARWEVFNKQTAPKKEVVIDVADYKFYLHENPLRLRADEPVKFILTSRDVTYGFGIFRSDGTMVFQMQVLPGRANKIVWIFRDEGKYTIRSTEYSGPENWKMILRDAIAVEK